MTPWRYLLGSALLLASSSVATHASADPTRWLGTRFDLPLLMQPSRVLSTPLLVLAPQPAPGSSWPTAASSWPTAATSGTRFQASASELSPSDAQLAALLARRPTLEYTPRDSSLTLSLEPGSPCTGACFKLAGWF